MSDHRKYMAILKLDEAEIRSRRAFFKLSDEDLVRLASLRPFAEKVTDGIVEEFYALLLSQWSLLDSLYFSESGWRVDADNPTSSAYGIPQALTQLHDLPADYMTSAESQIRWGLEYIRGTYGTPCSAWSFKQGNNWY